MISCALFLSHKMGLKMVGHHAPKDEVQNARWGAGKSWILLAFFAAIVAIEGGASRYDAIQIVPLRAFSALFLVLALAFLTKGKIRSDFGLVVIFGSLVIIVLSQIVPLPPSFWQNLAGRGEIVELDAAVGQGGAWRPLTLAPMRTWNVLGSLVVPAAALFVGISLSTSSTALLRIVAGLGIASATLGLLQMVAGKASALYFYDVTNEGSPVGILANENHAAIFAACCMLVVTFLGLNAREAKIGAWERLLYPIAFVLLLFVSLVGGSRAGLVAALSAGLVSMIMLFLASRPRQKRRIDKLVQRGNRARPSLVLIVPVVLVSLAAVSFLALDRSPAFRDILTGDTLEDLRWSLWPVIVSMLENHFLFGTGFGSFEQAYHVYEPANLLMPLYVNQAHNDWAQFVIEGGVLACALVVVLLAWLGRNIGVTAIRSANGVNAVFYASLFVLVGVASVIDYPLRTPLFQLVTVWLLLALSRDARDKKATEVASPKAI